MPLAKPTLGYPSRTAAIEAMLAADLSVSEIADRIGCSTDNVTGLIGSARSRVSNNRVKLQHRTLQALAKQALMRGVTVHELAEQLLEVIVRDDVFDALLGELDEGGDA